MTSEEKDIARRFFTFRIHQSHGNAFELLFAQVMAYSRAGFLKVKPYGSQGDRGNDGYEKEHGRYFQVYAPENPCTKKRSTIIRKLKDDFAKLKQYWDEICEIKEYYFTFNDKYTGTFIEIEKNLAELKAEYKLQTANVFFITTSRG